MHLFFDLLLKLVVGQHLRSLREYARLIVVLVVHHQLALGSELRPLLVDQPIQRLRRDHGLSGLHVRGIRRQLFSNFSHVLNQVDHGPLSFTSDRWLLRLGDCAELDLGPVAGHFLSDL